MGTYKRRIFTLRMIIERNRAVNAKIYICFIDNQKAFDRVKHNKLMKVLDKAGIPVPDLERRLIKKIMLESDCDNWRENHKYVQMTVLLAETD